MKDEVKRPTEAELEILKVLWQQGACTVREVYESINSYKSIGYTTVLKLMQIMVEKGLVRRDEAQRAHVYEAQYEQEQTENQMVQDLVERLFDGSAMKLVMRALSSKKASQKELAEIRKVLDEYERGRKQKWID